jgi:hypothetical protein
MTEREDKVPARRAWCGRERDATHPEGWAPPAERGRGEPVRTHGVCPDCHRELMREANGQSGG